MARDLRAIRRSNGSSDGIVEVSFMNDVLSNQPQLCMRESDGTWRPATGEEVIATARRELSRRVERATTLANPEDVRDFLAVQLGDESHEVFAVLFLDNRNRLIEYRELFRGTVDGASVYPREVVKDAIALNATSVVLAHNHPSGVAEPSAADEQITRRLKAALALVDIRVLDHLVVGGGDAISFAERGLL